MIHTGEGLLEVQKKGNGSRSARVEFMVLYLVGMWQLKGQRDFCSPGLRM